MSPLKHIRTHWSLTTRLSLGVLLSVTLLFVAALFIMFHYSRLAIEKESLAKAEETLHETTHRINNMLYEVEVATKAMCWNVEHHLDNPDLMAAYTRQIVKDNPAIEACAIAFEPGYYPQKGELFMAHSYKDKLEDNAITTSFNPMEIEQHFMSSLPYPGHNWYFIPKQAKEICWVRPHAATDTILSSIITCCMPIRDPQGRVVGVIGSDVSVDWLSTTVLNTKPYPNSYCCVLGVQGTYIIHPDTRKLYHTFVRDIIKDSSDDRVEKLVDSMLKGEAGCKAVNLFGVDSYVVYQPFNNGHWSACLVCPEEDIFSASVRLEGHMMAITAIGLMIIFFFCMAFINVQMRPLSMLTKLTTRISKGEYNLPIRGTTRSDEIGTLQNAFHTMQNSLQIHMLEINRLGQALQERNESLNRIYAQVRNTNRMNTLTIHRIADKMIPSAKIIESSVLKLQSSHEKMKQEEFSTLSDIVLQQIKNITDLLDKMLKKTQPKKS